MDFELQNLPKRIGRYLGLGKAGEVMPRYPLYYYHDSLEPLLVHDEKEENEAKLKGYDAFTAGMLANKTVVNWFWDLEDLSAKQLVVFAKDEFGVDLPNEASQDVLYKAVCQLSRTSPQNENRLVLIAQVLEMKLDETMAEIRRMVGGGIGVEIETEVSEVTM